jgi:hypothetical protein
MALTAAYTGLRWGELAALTAAQLDQARRVITVDRKVVEVAGHLFVEAPKNRKLRRTIYPAPPPPATLSPAAWPTGPPPWSCLHPRVRADTLLRAGGPDVRLTGVTRGG